MFRNLRVASVFSMGFRGSRVQIPPSRFFLTRDATAIYCCGVFCFPGERSSLYRTSRGASPAHAMVSRTSLDIQRRRARSRALRDKSCQNAKGYESHSLGRSTFLTPRPSSEGDSWRTWSPTRRYVASASATPLAKRYQPWSSPCHTST